MIKKILMLKFLINGVGYEYFNLIHSVLNPQLHFLIESLMDINFPPRMVYFASV